MDDTYHGSTVDELRTVPTFRRVLSVANQASLFAHSGPIRLADDRLELGDWMTLQPHEIASVSQEFVPEYGRFAAGGARGGFPSLGVFGRAGMPIILDLVTGVRLVLVIGFHPLSGRTRNTEWLPALSAFATP